MERRIGITPTCSEILANTYPLGPFGMSWNVRPRASFLSECLPRMAKRKEQPVQKEQIEAKTQEVSEKR